MNNFILNVKLILPQFK